MTATPGKTAASLTPQSGTTPPLESNELAWERERLSGLENNSRFLMTFAAVFAIALGFGSWKTLDDQRRSASDNLDLLMKRFDQKFEQAMAEHSRTAKEAMEDVRTLRAEIHQDFPMFGRMRRNFSRILLELQSACRRLEPTDETYDRLSWEDRERILFHERAVADSLLLDTRDYAEQLSEIYRLLGVFYGSRHAHYEIQHQTPPQQGDLDRARFYFDRAIQIDPANHLALSHAGHFTMYYANRRLAVASREYLRQAAEVGKASQRPLVNLALLELEAFNNPDAALVAIEEAFNRTQWELPGSQPKNHHCQYVQACAFARKASSATDPSESESCLEAASRSLREAAEFEDGWITNAFNIGDFQTPPDRIGIFASLSAHPRFADGFQAVCDKLRSV